jgi:hypothetical protein
LTSVYVNVRTPLYADNEENDIFPLRSNTTLYVPYGCKATYESADYWQDFKEILEMAPTEVNVNIGYKLCICDTKLGLTLKIILGLE